MQSALSIGISNKRYEAAGALTNLARVVGIT